MTKDKFKVGDRVRCIEANFRDLTVGKVYEVSDVDTCDVCVIDDSGETNCWGKYELATPEWGAPITGGRPDVVSDDDEAINKLDVEVEAEWWQEAFEPYRLRADHPYYASLETTDELTDLREFKRKALERYPELEPKSETDEEAAERLADGYVKAVYMYPKDLALDAINWARDNPRA